MWARTWPCGKRWCASCRRGRCPAGAGPAAARRSELQRARVSLAARPGSSRGRTSQSRAGRCVPPAESLGISERGSRPTRSRGGRQPRCSPPTTRVTASTTSISAASRRRCSIAISPRHRRSAGWRSARRCATSAHTVVLPPDLTQDEQFERSAVRHARRHGVPAYVSRRCGLPLRHPPHARSRRENRRESPGRSRSSWRSTGGGLQLFTVAGRPLVSAALESRLRIRTPPQADAGLNVRIPVKAGPHTIAVAFLKRPSALAETERQPFKASYNGRERGRDLLRDDRGPVRRGAARATHRADGGSSRAVLDRPAEDEACARTILSTLARRAYRRPVIAADVDDAHEASTRTGAVEGAGFEAGIEMALRALLVSPGFLFRIEHGPGAESASRTRSATSNWRRGCRSSSGAAFPTRNCSTLAIARQAERSGGARSPGAAAARRSARRRARRTTSPTSGCICATCSRRPATRGCSPISTTTCGRRSGARPSCFFESIVREDRSVLDLLRADYTFVNERLARHYGIPNVYGSHFRRVTFDEDSVRGGLLGQGSILTATSYANRTSPVQRGKWVLENVLGMPPPPAAGGRAATQGSDGARQGADDARADDRAPHESDRVRAVTS